MFVRDPDLSFIEAMERAVMSADFSKAGLYLDPEIIYTVGARQPIKSIQGILSYVEEQSRIARWEGHTLLGAWANQNVTVVEVISHFTRLADGRNISFPCTDIYRFRDGKISDWRVYADMSPFSVH